MSPNPAVSVSCTECEQLSLRITQLEKRIETLQDIRVNEEFIDSVVASVHATELSNGLSHIFIREGMSNVEPAATDLADTLPWMCSNDIGIAEENPKLDHQTDLSFWNTVGARPKSSTPARTWADVVRRRGKSSRKFKAPALTPPPEVSLHNKYDVLSHIKMNDDECNARIYQNSRNSPKTQPRANQTRRRGQNPTNRRTREATGASTQKQIDTILIGDSITQHVRMAKTENLTLFDTSVRELTEMLPTILSSHPDGMKIIVHTGSFDILRRKIGSEILKKDFSLLLERLCQLGAHHVYISGPIPTAGKGIELFSRLLGLNTWLSNACVTHGIKFIDNFNIFWNCKERFRPDGVHPNLTGCRLLGAHLRHAVGTANPNMSIQIRAKDTAEKQPTPSSPPSPDPLLHITQGLQRMSLSRPEPQRPPSTKKYRAPLPPPPHPPIRSSVLAEQGTGGGGGSQSSRIHNKDNMP